LHLAKNKQKQKRKKEKGEVKIIPVTGLEGP
jgi:hypothetical protein